MGYVSEIFHDAFGRPVRTGLLHKPRWRGSAPPADAVAVTWLGTAGLAVAHGGAVLLVDPFVTRPGLLATATGPLAPDPDAIRRYLPEARVVAVTHSHHDHLLDVPEVARQTGAVVVGSTSSCNLCRASGLEETQIREVDPPDVVEVQPFRLELRRSLHGKAVLGRVPLPGEIPADVRPPLRLAEFRTTGTFGLHVTVGEGSARRRIFHLGSADFYPETIEGLECDLLVACLVGRQRRPDFLRDLVRALRPRNVVPCHYDDFFVPMERRTRALPGVDLEGFLREVKVWGDGAEAVVLDRLDTFVLP